MTTFYLDFEGGNDAADGTSFANRWKTINAGATNARIAPGDIIRVMASRDPTSIGTCTWTDASDTVTLAAAKTQTIWNGDEAWTGVSANITGSANTSRRKIGTTCATITPGSAFTTGKVAYFTLPAELDLSGYTRVSFWVMMSNATSAWQLKLCSDTGGDTPVDTLSIPSGRSNNWVMLEVDNGGALGASIKSIALHATSDPGTNVLRIQNIIACKAVTEAGALSHRSVLVNNDGDGEAYWPIDTIDGTTIILGGEYGRVGLGSSDYPRIPYRGSGGSLTTYALTPINVTAQQDVQDSGTDGAPIAFSFGWNRTDMSTRESWSDIGIDASTFVSSGYMVSTFSAFASKNYVSWSAFGACHFYDAALYLSNQYGARLVDVRFSGCRYPVQVYETSVANGYTYLSIVTTMGAYGLYLSQGIAADVVVEDSVMRNGHSGAIFAKVPAGGLTVVNSLIESGGTSAAIETSGQASGPLNVVDCDLRTQGSADVLISGSGSLKAAFANSLFSQTGWCDASAAARATLVTSHNHNNSSGDHRIVSRGWSGASEATVRHTASGLAWKVSPTDTTYCDSSHRAQIPLARIACNGSTTVTIKCWVRRTNTGITAGIEAKRGAVSGLESASMTAAADTWEELTLTVSPTANGVIEVFGFAYGGTTYSAYFDDMTITST